MSSSLTEIRGVTESGVTLYLDGKVFIDCGFTDCALVYAGGDWSHHNTIFMNCPIHLVGPALRSANFLHLFNFVQKDEKGALKPVQEPTAE